MVKSSKQWLRRHVTDPYVRMAREQGYRSRAAFKLLEINEREKLMAELRKKEGEEVALSRQIFGWEELQKAKAESSGLGLFVRSLVGLDREAAKQAMAGFMAGKTLGANQIEFVNLIVEHLTEHGVMNAELLYESPFTDLNPQGPEGVFNSDQVDELVSLLGQVRGRAVA